LNAKRFAGFGDWRLPTLEEAMSLMEQERKNAGLYIDTVFDRRQEFIWTVACIDAEGRWFVLFPFGSCIFHVFDGYFVRAVRS
jgi:hypothetical protein